MNVEIIKYSSTEYRVYRTFHGPFAPFRLDDLAVKGLTSPPLLLVVMELKFCRVKCVYKSMGDLTDRLN